MKNILTNITTILFALYVVVLNSCSDATDIIQVGELNEDVAFQSLADVQSGLSGAYSNYGPDSGSNDAGVDAIYFNEIFTDNLKAGIDNLGQGDLTYAYNLEAGSDSPGTIWANRYATINASNRVIRAIDKIDFTSEEISAANHIKGQLIGLRALSHFDLFQYFTVDYQSPESLAIINLDFVPNIQDTFERNTVAQTIAFIKNDLDMADDLLDPAATNIIFINKDVIKALRTRLALFEGDYDTAMTLSGELVDDYPLANQAQYFNVFSDTDNTEVIFKLSRIVGDRQVAGLWYFNDVAIDGDPYLEMSNELYNQFDNTDIRFFVNVHPDSDVVGVNDPDNIILINKYPGSSDGDLRNDIKIFRSSEMLLIRAETEARNNQLLDAANSIQELRIARYDTAAPALPVFNSIDEALMEILKERRKELSFEGHRYLDLKRLGQELGLGIDRENVDCASFNLTNCNLAVNDYRFTLPIPTAEIEGNGLITQNPKY